MDSKKNQTSAVSMTEGSLWKNIFLFSCPLIFSQLLEVLFNLSDVAVVGRFADYRALGSVGSTSLLVTLFTGFLIGMGAGVNVRVAHGLGAGNQKETEETIHSSFLICLVTGLIICAVGLTSSRVFLALLHTKDELMEGAVNYLQIYSLGMPAMGLYNFGNGVMSARGDTKRPLVYLLIAGVLNVIMNLIFVIGFHMAAEGVAIASVMAQYTSAGLVLHHLWRRRDVCRLQLRKVCFHRMAGKAVLMLGIPGGLQQAIFAIANLFVQAGVNSFDAVTVSGNAAAANTDPLVYNSMFAFYTACASFMSRNLGAGKKGTGIEKLFYLPDICFFNRSGSGWMFLLIWRWVLIPVCNRACRDPCGKGTAFHHGLFVCDLSIYGLFHRSLPRNRKECRTYSDRHSWFLCIPCDLGIYDLCPFPHADIPVSALCIFVDHYRSGRGGVLLEELQEDCNIKI